MTERREVAVGDAAERRVVLDEALVRRYSDVVNDHNPLHLDPAVAATSRFGRPIVHGMLLASLFSGLIADELPGPGSIYPSQTARFRRPVPVGSEVRVRLEVREIDASRITADTFVYDETDEVCVAGEAVILLE